MGGIALVFIGFDVLTRGHTAALSIIIANERLEAKTEREIMQRQSVFARMIAHEIRTPAASICGALDLMREVNLDSIAHAYVDIIAGGAEQILTLVRCFHARSNTQTQHAKANGHCNVAPADPYVRVSVWTGGGHDGQQHGLRGGRDVQLPPQRSRRRPRRRAFASFFVSPLSPHRRILCCVSSLRALSIDARESMRAHSSRALTRPYQL